ncbi:hypothetical protein AOLI_G00268410 [Acnodon oligacanthus]
MKRYSVQDLWKNVTGGQPQGASYGANLSESNSTDVSSITQTTRQSSDDFPMNVVSVMPAQPPSSSDSQVSDGDKAGAMLLFSGIFLSLVGMTFTTMGWINYEVSASFEWTQLLGPVLLSVGGTFVLISICKFRMFSCQTCKVQSDERVPEIDLPPLAGPSFIFSGINQPITFHRATMVQYIPPPYTSGVQDRSLNPINRFQSSQQPLAVTMSAPPQYYSVYPMDNPTFLEDNGTQEQTADTRETRYGASVRIQNQSGEVEEEKAEASESTSPPAYEDLFPTTLCDSSSR